MIIKDISFEKLSLPLISEFHVAFGTISSTTSIIVKISTDTGLVGFGEAAPLEFVTGENCDTVICALSIFRNALIGMDIMNIEGIHEVMDSLIAHNTSAKCAIDIAIYDLQGKSAGLPLYKLLGGYSNCVQSDITIGINEIDQMVAEAIEHCRKGFRILKIKAGINVMHDVEAVARIREAVGPDCRLRIDANQGYRVADGIYAAKHMEKYHVEAIEQCLPAWDIEGHARIRQQAEGVRIMLDESVHSPYDAFKIASCGAGDILNIKLMKCGGLYPALKINAIAESAGMKCMVGCMMETKLAITAALSLVAAKKNITEADCDSCLFFKDPEMGMPGGYTMDRDIFTLTEEPGLGLQINM